MISKHKINLIRSLKNKNHRTEHQLFAVEGVKMVNELLNSKFQVHEILYTEDWKMPAQAKNYNCTFTHVSSKELKRISQLTTPNQVLALARIPVPSLTEAGNNLMLALDNIQDPGNLGTIIRTADWFGIDQLIASPTTADVYNPKVIQATMGSVFRVSVFYTELAPWLINQHKEHDMPVYGAVLGGENLFTSRLTANGIIVLGNESKGISEHVMKAITHKITIPTYPNTHQGAESLNVSIANAILCAEFRRQQSIL